MTHAPPDGNGPPDDLSPSDCAGLSSSAPAAHRCQPVRPTVVIHLTLSLPEAGTLYDELMHLGALTRPAAGPTAADLTPPQVLARVSTIDTIRQKLAVALGADGGT